MGSSSKDKKTSSASASTRTIYPFLGFFLAPVACILALRAPAPSFNSVHILPRSTSDPTPQNATKVTEIIKLRCRIWTSRAAVTTPHARPRFATALLCLEIWRAGVVLAGKSPTRAASGGTRGRCAGSIQAGVAWRRQRRTTHLRTSAPPGRTGQVRRLVRRRGDHLRVELGDICKIDST